MSNLILTSSTAVGVAVVGVVGIIRSDGGLEKLNITIGTTRRFSGKLRYLMNFHNH